MSDSEPTTQSIEPLSTGSADVASTSSDSTPFSSTSKNSKPRILLSGTPEEILSRNTTAAPPHVVDKLVQRSGAAWSKFYKNHASQHNLAKTPDEGGRFFKDRHWCEREWGLDEVLDSEGRGEGSGERGKGKTVLEVGCGTGAFVYPLLERYPAARFVAFDFANKAVELTLSHPLHTPSSVHAFQHDLTAPLPSLHDSLRAVPPEFGEIIEKFDIVSSIFVLSAIAPNMQRKAVETLVSLLAPGGSLLFRDYALHDAAQLRFHSLPSASYAAIPSLLSARTEALSRSDELASSNSPLDPSSPSSASPSSSATAPSNPDPAHPTNLPWYKRGDNTLTYFFTPSEISAFVASACEALGVELEGGVEVVEREMMNRKEGWGCTRKFVSGRWRRVK
ncbi:hypothetical protein JCM8547_002438 [Rhodosporidiobolus lusitaniae]